MALRRFILIALAASTAAMAGTIRSYPLDEHAVYTIRISRDEPTTCVFPGPLSALEGANAATKPETDAPILVSYQSGANFFSLRALSDKATGALNVVFRGKVYALSFASSATPDRAVTFLDAPREVDLAVARTLIERAKSAIRGRDSTVALTLERSEPRTVTTYRNFTVTIEEVLRLQPHHALVFRLRFENSADAPVQYYSQGLTVRMGSEIFPALHTDASGAIPPRGTSDVWLVIGRSLDGGRVSPSVDERFSILVPFAR